MNNLNWRDASKELPDDDRNVVVSVLFGDKCFNAYDFYNTDIKDWCCHKKEDGYKVLRFIYLHEIPLPKE